MGSKKFSPPPPDKIKIKKDDQVKVIAGRDRGKRDGEQSAARQCHRRCLPNSASPALFGLKRTPTAWVLQGT